MATGLLFPSRSNLAVFAKGEFVFTDTVGVIFLCLALLALAVLGVSRCLVKIKHVWLRWVGYLATFGISGLTLLLVVTCAWIGYDVKSQCSDASARYQKENCVEALTSLLTDEKQNFRSRNHAIWALGQLGDKRVLPLLEKYYTGIIPDREPLDSVLSQYELQKAIKLLNGGFNNPDK